MRLSRFVEFGRKIICVGRNYKEHAEELGHAVPKEPLLFMKPPTAYITEGQSIMIPRDCEELDHEVELGVVVGRRGSAIRAEEALDYVAGYVVALDMTDRQLQRQCQAQGHPWERAKGFDTSCPVGQFLPKESVSDPHALTLWCKVNGQQRQKGSTSHMLFTIQQLLEAASARFTLEPGDLLLTGTPSGVGPVHAGDVVEAGIEGLGQVRFPVEQQMPKQ
ncbi:acylpyruvase FAHD1, mitochondrial [Dermacentor silvarum]|uniref:acylpyruvase FAHD1, mitochondrial n=1 Tax=Dermacentor silvarum TaxID=543639 RepID=UPI00189AAEA8|nr:acylpyruvase FAHD1, mitochondrial [Dermacentor silvarum]